MSWMAEKWYENGGEYADSMSAPDTLEKSYDEYTGRAVFYESASSETPVKIDFIITSIDYSFNEHMKVDDHIGNSFSFIAFGKDAMVVQVNGVIIDTGKNYGKDSFLDFYRNYLRMEAVARRGKAPILCFPDAAFYCAATGVNLTETSESEDVVYAAINLEILKAVFVSEDCNFMLDYLHGVELSETSIYNTAAASDYMNTSGGIVEVLDAALQNVSTTSSLGTSLI